MKIPIPTLVRFLKLRATFRPDPPPGGLIDVDLIVSSHDEWHGRPEARDAAWGVISKPAHPFVVAARMTC